MNKTDIKELFYIIHISNLDSVMKLGILCYNKAQKIKNRSIYDLIVQDRRHKAKLPNGKDLHDFANLYFNARNAMMFSRKETHRELCVLVINPKILNMADVMLADRNASSSFVRFYSVSEIQRLDKDLIFNRDWRNEDYYEYRKQRSMTCAEVLIPGFIPNVFIQKIYVSNDETFKKIKSSLEGNSLNTEVEINKDIFFQ